MTDPGFPAARGTQNEALIAYALFALGYVTGIALLAGLVYAYLVRGKDGLADSHLTYLINGFWISVAVLCAALILLVVGVGFLILLVWPVWGLARIISGFLLLQEQKPITGTRWLGAVAT